MICGAIFFGTFPLACGLVAMGTGRLPTNRWRAARGKGLLRDEHPLQFWVMDFLLIAIGLAFIIYGFVGSLPPRR